jgi:SAM-dependent methyltransferase
MNWTEEWNRSIRLTSRERLNCGAFWDERARPDRRTFFDDALTEDQLSIIQPCSDQEIIEIGPGNGRLTIPLAKVAKSVTAIDPSYQMLEVLRGKAEAAGLRNIRIMNQYWEGFDLTRNIRADKLVTSYSLFMYDIAEQLRRMGSAAKEVFIFLPGELRIPFPVQEIMFGSPMVQYTDLEIVVNAAKELGFKPSSWIINYPGWSFESERSLKDHYCDLFGATGELKEAVCQHLEGEIKQEDGRFMTGAPLRVGVVHWQ